MADTTLLEGWDGRYDSLPAEAKMLVEVGYEVGYDRGYVQARMDSDMPPFTPRDAEAFAVVIRRKRQVDGKGE